MFFTKRQRPVQEMSNPEILELLLNHPESIFKISKERLVRYLETELDGRNLIELFQKLDFDAQKYFSQVIPPPKMQNMLKSAIKFHHDSFINAFMKFLCNLITNRKQAPIENILCTSSEEELFSILWDMLYQMKEEEFFVFYQNAAKSLKIEILETIFGHFSNTIGNCLLRCHAKTALEKLEKLDQISTTERLYLAYAYSIQ